MEKQYEYNGQKYWVKVEPVINTVTDERNFVAYVSNEKPGGLLYGEAVKTPEGATMLFSNELVALTNANAVKKSEMNGE
jgi:hypothetical protein